MKSILFCAAFLFGFNALQAQFATSGDYEALKSFGYEMASFSNPDACEQVTIQSKDAVNLTAFELKTMDAHVAYSWSGNEKPEGRFPMKFNLLPGKGTLRYRMKGEGWKSISFEVEKGKPLTINLEQLQANG